MGYVRAQPQALATAAADVEALVTTINEATARAATGVVAAGADEVSGAIATLFNDFAHECQAVMAQAALCHDEFAQTLAAAGAAYAGTEAASVGTLAGETATTGDIVTFVMGGSGTPTPTSDFVTNIFNRYVVPNFPVGLLPQGLSLPAGEYPDTGVKDLTQDVSIARGVTILNNAIQEQLKAGNTINVVGYSQSANIASLEMRLLAPGDTPSALPINFVLLGNSMNPNGGWDARFPGLSLPTLGFTTLGAAPSNSFPTKVYTIEYDGWADFPQYPINIVSDLNALAGMVTAHTGYETLTPEQISSAIVLPTHGPSTTTYYMIPNQHLPLLEPVRYIPYVGNPIADLVQPVLRPLVNWGYGNPDYGWSTGAPDVPTPFGFLPPLSDTLALGPAMINGIPQGIAAATNTLYSQGLPQLPSLQGLAETFTSSAPLALPNGPSSITDVLLGIEAANTQFVGNATHAFSTAYATLLPTADAAIAALVSLPSYDVNLFLNGLIQAVNGQPLDGLINAFGNPIAANVGLLTLIGGLEVAVLGEAADSILTGTPYPSP
ncbi:PE family protein [Mycobacterium angelicum]|uniref:PE family protein n=1 Tax=Mycobacterium angelicum TaxID=470074 RepID=A0A1X0A3X1_MYCAN|nr:PE-PPE domain-containing protein [Mycobacterium angelicum]MCV7197917.1 PE-PPE domain-containing protein [Mycobacterium angelicum]ORA24704.1 hypothetical protein BST12_04345 [Mycobacterium angelicum]